MHFNHCSSFFFKEKIIALKTLLTKSIFFIIGNTLNFHSNTED